MRIIWIGGWHRFSCGEARYYGWNLMLFAGPAVICIWPTRQEPADDLPEPF